MTDYLSADSESLLETYERGGVAVNTATNAIIASPRFSLIPSSIVCVNGRRCVVERRLADKWWFLDESTHEPFSKTDLELAELQKNGQFFVDWLPGDKATPPLPVHPLNVGADSHAKNQYKLAFVLACTKHPDYGRSRRILKPLIAEQARKFGKQPPCFTTVLRWIDQFKRHGTMFGAAALADRHDKKGRYGKRLAEYQEKAIEVGIGHWLKRNTKANAYASVCDAVQKFNDSEAVDKGTLDTAFLDARGCLRPPSLRQFERRCNQVDPAVSAAMRIGARYSKQHFRTYGTTALPERPYAHVEIDHCTLDILLKHPKGLILGRPDLVVFRDRATGLILGWGFGFDQPSYASFLVGLRQAIHGPDVAHIRGIKNRPTWFGRIENLYHDNALHMIGDSIEAAAPELGINLIRLAPREPWLKSQMESWFRKLGIGFVHSLPGTTLEHAVARRDHENLGEATLTTDQFEALLARWILDVFNVSPSKSLGFIRGFDGGTTPLDAWRAKSKDYETDLLPSREMFIAQAGQIKDRTIQKNGVTIDHIIYENPNLARILGNPKHKRKGATGGPTKYKIARDPHDLGYVVLVDHHTGDRLKVPATAAHSEYANGLTLVEHQIILKNALGERNIKELTFKDLIGTKAELNALAAQIAGGQKYKTVQRRVARYLEGDRSREQRSRIHAFTPDGTDYLALAPASPPTTLVRAIGASSGNTTARNQRVRNDENVVPENISPGSDDYDQDISELRKQKNWS